MASYIPVPRDLTKVKSKVAFNLTKRQLICFCIAAAIGVPTFFLLKKIGDSTFAAIYKSIPSDRMNGVKTIGFVINDDQLLANEYDLVVGNRLNMQEMKDILPELAAHPQVVKAADEIAKLLPELEGLEKSSMKEKLKEKSKAANAKRAKSSKKKEEVAI